MILTIGNLKKVIENVPEDFTVEYVNDGISHPICDILEVDLSGKKLVLKSQ